jgi:hypothetical protein
MTDSTTNTPRPGRAPTVEQLLGDLLAAPPPEPPVFWRPAEAREERITMIAAILEPMNASAEEQQAAVLEATRIIDGG